MVTILFILGILAGLAVAAISLKLFLDSKKGQAFMGINLGSPKPAIAGIVLGVIAFLSLLIVFLSLSGSITEKEQELDSTEGELISARDDLKTAGQKLEDIKKELDDQKTKVSEAGAEINRLEKELKEKEASSQVASGDVERFKEELKSVREKLQASKKEVQALSSDVDIKEARIGSLNNEIENLKSELETEKQFRRDFMALVEEEEAAPSGTVRKVLYKLLDLKNKYKQDK